MGVRGPIPKSKVHVSCVQTDGQTAWWCTINAWPTSIDCVVEKRPGNENRQNELIALVRTKMKRQHGADPGPLVFRGIEQAGDGYMMTVGPLL